MNSSCETPEERLCGCCEGLGRETPEPIWNRSALRTISYRVGRHGTFKASLLAALSDPQLSVLAPLRTRDDSDFSIALLDAWATVLDILTFYQERLANESYLRTAVDSSSVMALAQLVGYKPSPGVAASALLAFTLSSAPGSPDNVLIPEGTRVQSVPKPGQTPQMFETSNDLTALISSNALPAQITIPWGLNPGDTFLWLQGTSNNIHVGDAILFVSKMLHDAAMSGSTSASGPADFHFVTSITADSFSNKTLITWDQPLRQDWPVPSGSTGDGTAYIYVFRKKAALFGSQAPDPRTLSTTNNGLKNLPGWPDGSPARADWWWQYTSGTSQINLDASYAGLAPPKTGEPVWTVLALASPDLNALYQITAAADINPTQYTVSSRATQLTLANGRVLNVAQLVEHAVQTANEKLVRIEAFTRIAHLALSESTIIEQAQQAQALLTALGLDWGQSIEARDHRDHEVANIQQGLTSTISDHVLAYIVSQTRSASAYIQSDLLTPADPPYILWDDYGGTYQRQPGLLKPVEGTALEIVGGQQLSSEQRVAVFGKRLRLQVSTAGQPLDSQAGFTPNGSTASQRLSDGQIFLVDAFPPSPVASSDNELWAVLTVDGVAGSLQINPSTILLTTADKNDPAAGETGVISQAPVSGAITALDLKQPLARIYDRSTVSVNANVVVATQGETMHEILGSGDAANPALNFTLKQAPLTYISSPTGMGASSTLEVWVNNLQWHEVDNFLESNPTDRVFVTKRDATGKTTVQFGDGEHGGRTPTGQMNLRALYRKGLGAAGNVQAGQLSQALDRPQGLKSVTNPDAATGGADPDSGEGARVSAPLHVLTLGRVVSLEDYHNYARAFSGIEKALATWTWFGRTRGVFLTVAGANGTVFQSDDDTITNLVKALRSVGNPFIPIQVASYVPVLFEVAATIRVDLNDYDPTQVLGQVWQSLSVRFSFEQRELGQGIAQSEVITLIQQTPGVIAVELTAFNLQGQAQSAGPALPSVLRAASPIPGQDGATKGAEMLVLDPASQDNLGVGS